MRVDLRDIIPGWDKSRIFLLECIDCDRLHIIDKGMFHLYIDDVLWEFHKSFDLCPEPWAKCAVCLDGGCPREFWED